ncbi:hypothetical protein ARHIZOSPH14_19130 [Agromyces rhizosphaerae]|uniref:Asparagine synthase n=1 Tax=Agromyces rhizosphaerae TaxID=88374 RepID=A0A9W6CRP4_9MICO|nr:hypothetical protein [Agromyces rhizosphaerae]GLI27671.1 hypothetical protein ARHIZOSPH14_19130 [Agromyces rhizosphaerae]
MGWTDLFRRRPKRRKMAPYRAPDINPDQPLREHVIDDGVMVARYSARLTLKNRIIVGALRGEDAFDTERYQQVAREVLDDLIDELDRSAERVQEVRRKAFSLPGRAKHEHDYRSRDLHNLEHREEVNTAVAARMRVIRDNAQSVEVLVKLARDDAWSEIGGEIARRSAETWHRYEDDPDYEQGRERRMRLLMREVAFEVKQAREAADGAHYA